MSPPNTEIYKQFIPGRPFFCRGHYKKSILSKDEYTINGMELVTLTDNDMNKDVTIFLNLESDRKWISDVVKGKRGVKYQKIVRGNNSSGRLESKRSMTNFFALLIFARMIWIEI